MNMRDKIARAIHAEDATGNFICKDYDKDLTDFGRECYLRRADAALIALSDPTLKMLDVEINGIFLVPEMMAKYFLAMIQNAKDGK